MMVLTVWYSLTLYYIYFVSEWFYIVENKISIYLPVDSQLAGSRCIVNIRVSCQF